MADKLVDEKAPTRTTHGRVRDEIDEREGALIVRREASSSDDEAGKSRSGSSRLKTSKNGNILIPQPSDDPDDPLNWSWMKKHAVFLALLPGCFLTDAIITYGTTLFEQQAPEFRMTPPDVSNSISGAVFMQGPGGLLAVPLAQRYGRLPVLFWSQFLSLVVSIGAYGAKGYAGFTACRTLQGFFAAAPQVIGLSIIHDMFFFHERARKVNLWAFSFLIGPYLGPFISAFIAEKLAWRQNMGVLCGFYGFSVLLIVLLGDETLFDRGKAMTQKPKGGLERVKRLTGVAGVRDSAGRPGLLEVTKDLFGLLLRPYLLLPTFGFITWITMWTIGMVNTVTLFTKPPPQAGGYGFSNTASALIYLAPMIGTILAEFWGHWFNDFLANRYIKRHGGRFMPENRLYGVYIPWIIGMAGLVLYGQTLQHHLHWIGLAFGWAMNCFSTLGTTVAISAYILDVFPQHAALASAWINAFRTIGGFSVTYFQLKWSQHSGPAVTFGCQAAIVAFFILSIIATQFRGEQWRRRFPAPTTSRTY